MANLRKLAKGQQCQVRIAGVCNFNSETTVLAHLRMAGVTGTGMKANDLLGAWCCSACHTATESNPALRKEFLEGVARTLNELVKMGVVTW